MAGLASLHAREQPGRAPLGLDQNLDAQSLLFAEPPQHADGAALPRLAACGAGRRHSPSRRRLGTG